jgi:hypothetical protein
MRKWIAPLVWFGDEIVRRIVTWVAFFGIVATVMSLAASYIMPIYKYGWGAVIFVGVGAACAIIIVISIALVAWRFFKPFPTSPPVSADAIVRVVAQIGLKFDGNAFSRDESIAQMGVEYWEQFRDGTFMIQMGGGVVDPTTISVRKKGDLNPLEIVDKSRRMVRFKLPIMSQQIITLIVEGH